MSIVATIETACDAGNVKLIATPSSGTSPYIYLWSTTETTQDITVTVADTYAVSITDSMGGNVGILTTISAPTCISEFSVIEIGYRSPPPEVFYKLENGIPPFTFTFTSGSSVVFENVNDREGALALPAPPRQRTLQYEIKDATNQTLTGSIRVDRQRSQSTLSDVAKTLNINPSLVNLVLIAVGSDNFF